MEKAGRIFSVDMISILVLVVVFGAANIVVRPHGWPFWLAGLLTPFVLIAVVYKLEGNALKDGKKQLPRAPINALKLASLLILAALASSAIENLGETPLTDRIAGIGLGAIFLVCGNAIPKQVAAMEATLAKTAFSQRVNRQFGWILSLHGVALMLNWIFVPQALAAKFGFWITVAMTAAILIRILLVGVTCAFHRNALQD